MILNRSEDKSAFPSVRYASTIHAVRFAYMSPLNSSLRTRFKRCSIEGRFWIKELKIQLEIRLCCVEYYTIGETLHCECKAESTPDSLEIFQTAHLNIDIILEK